ncbi:hypothetical protein BJ878DRAFT_182580 [Calycina marina]|uniref:Uncharacterized protein n=1 Tax=Calycina marina TaxID=1763456 RepID=A0A9P7Z8M2_9HELO|nr:hypothetical protein BJ878DRAFT_182580 [Calycina marina]
MLGAFPVAAPGNVGPQTVPRRMVQTGYSYGLYASSVIVLLNMAIHTVWTIVLAGVGGQTLGAVSGDKLSWTLGIVSNLFLEQTYRLKAADRIVLTCHFLVITILILL